MTVHICPLSHEVKMFLKNYAKNEAGGLLPDLFFLKKSFVRSESLLSIYFDSPQLGIQ